MSRKGTSLLKAALSAMHATRADEFLAPLTGGAGVIFTLHHVSPEPARAFEPNRILKITPEFLEAVIRQVIEQGFDVIAIDDVPARLEAAAEPGQRPFAVFTFDDGYRDNRDHALPVFRKYGLPFTIYIPTDYPGGDGELWWLDLEAAIRVLDEVVVAIGGVEERNVSRTDAEKDEAFHRVYWKLRALPEVEMRAIVAELAASAGIDTRAAAADLLMTWDEIRELAADPLVTLAAHTKGHLALAKLSEDEARAEIVESIARLEAEIGRKVRHFSFPYGDEASAGPREFRLAAEAGLETAVTTRKGLVHARHARTPTALPRVSLNGDYQDSRYVKVLLSGVPFAFWDAVGRLRGRAAA
ncbi:MAG: polysaccharide deacetylase family protein [Hyphomicrobium sp.]|nr:polysaccharide deacetylase family protein [Hyphomicrobium sp.]